MRRGSLNESNSNPFLPAFISPIGRARESSTAHLALKYSQPPMPTNQQTGLLLAVEGGVLGRALYRLH